MITRKSPQRFIVNLRFLCFLCLICLCMGISCLAESSPTLLYIRGCINSDPPRDTRGCFAHAENSESLLRLSIHGLNFTPHGSRNQEEPLFRVVLRESVAPPPLSREEAEGDINTSTSSLSRPLELLCKNITVFSALHSQVIYCNLPHPNSDLTAAASLTQEVRAEQRRRLYNSPMWFDLFLESNSGDNFKLVGHLRRCVEIDLTQSFQKKREGGRLAGVGDLLIGGIHPNQHPKYFHLHKENPAPDATDLLADLDSVLVQLEIGGLRTVLETLYRRVVLPRHPSQAPLLRALGLARIHGIVLYGPQGNGKTLLAQAVAQLLEPRVKLTIVSAVDILLNYANGKDQSLRDVLREYSSGTFARSDSGDRDGKVHTRTVPDLSDDDKNLTHVLVIDDFGALFQQDGFSVDESAQNAMRIDTTRALLSLMNERDTPNDLLIIGLATQLHSIDSDLLIPGGFEVQIQIPEPDARACENIFLVHTRKLRDASALPLHVDFSDLARRAVGFSGADIASVVRAAVSHALLRQQSTSASAVPVLSSFGSSIREGTRSANGWTNSVGTPSKVGDMESITSGFQLLMDDFNRALREVRRTKDNVGFLGYKLGETKPDDARELIDYDGTLQRSRDRVRELVSQILRSRHMASGIVVLTGGPGHGKTVTVQQLVTSIQPAFVPHFISCRQLTQNQSSEQQVQQVRDAICRASRLERGLVVLDDYDMLLDSLSNTPHLVSSLKNILYNFANGDSSGVCSPVPGTADPHGAFGGTSTRSAKGERQVLIMTMTRESTLQGAPYDLHLRRFPLSISGIERLIVHYRIASKPSLVGPIARAYPSSLSYRQFLRLTDMALWRLKESATLGNKTSDLKTSDGSLEAGRESRRHATANATESKKSSYELPWVFASVEHSESDDAMQFGNCSLANIRAKQEREDFFALSTSDMAREFIFSVHEVVGLTGLADPFAGWYRGSGVPVQPNDGDEEKDGVDMGAEGSGLEVLW